MAAVAETIRSNSNNNHVRLRRWIARDFRVLIAYGLLLGLLALYAYLQPRLFTLPVITATANQGMSLVFAGMGQTAVVITGGIDLSIGSIVSLTNCLASTIFGDSVFSVVGGFFLVLAVGTLAGLINGLIVVYTRLQPIVVTLATASVYNGLALFLRPVPGGSVPGWYTDLLTGRVFDVIPSSLICLAVVVLVVWIPFRKSRIGLWAYALGGNETSAFMSGLNVNRAKLVSYAVGGLCAAIGGLFLSAQTSSGNATIGAIYTLQSIAAVVLGGTSLLGGVGGIMGTIAGAFVLRIISSVLFFAKVNPLSQPFFEGVVLLIAVLVGATRLLTLRNKLDSLR
ncbi:MAG: ABC transporter permease [Chloroflexi bacterium]|nr:ABC transporter permease [Chloroflexota bacterium]